MRTRDNDDSIRVPICVHCHLYHYPQILGAGDLEQPKPFACASGPVTCKDTEMYCYVVGPCVSVRLFFLGRGLGG